MEREETVQAVEHDFALAKGDDGFLVSEDASRICGGLDVNIDQFLQTLNVCSLRPKQDCKSRLIKE